MKAAVAKRAGWRMYRQELLRNPALVTWCLFVLLTPIYVFKSGLPQPGDVFLFLLAPLSLARWDGRLDRHTSRMVRALLWFTVWVCVVNYGWALVLWHWNSPKDYLIFPIFYLFNVAVFFSAVVLARPNPERFLRITVDVVVLTIAYQVVASFFYRTDLYRGQVFFNSPNQLGYYALLSACLIAMAQRRLALSRFKAGFAVTGCAYLAVLSASRASVAGILILLAVMLFSNPRTIILASIVGIALLSLGGPISDAISTAEKRALEDRDPKTSFVEERGYDRIWNNPEYLVLGAGEGDVVRFERPGETARELHSSFAGLWFAYGFVGLGLFGTFAFRVLRRSTLRDAVMLVPVVAYTVAHNGLRATMFWVVIAAFVVLQQVPNPVEKGLAAGARART